MKVFYVLIYHDAFFCFGYQELKIVFVFHRNLDILMHLVFFVCLFYSQKFWKRYAEL